MTAPSASLPRKQDFDLADGRNALSPDARTAIVSRLSRYTGLDTAVIDKKTLIVDRRALQQNRLRGQGAIAMFDTRQIVRREASMNDRAEEARRRALINGYLRDALAFKTDLAYQGLESGWSASGKARDPNAEWKWDQGDLGAPLELVDDGPPGGTPPWVQRTFSADPTTRTFVAAGIYDSLNSCPLIAYQISRLEPALRARITFGCYAGGHMMYEDRASRVTLRRDLARFFDGASR